MPLREIGVDIQMDIDNAPLRRLDDHITQVVSSINQINTSSIDQIGQAANNVNSDLNSINNNLNDVSGNLNDISNNLQDVNSNSNDINSNPIDQIGDKAKKAGGLVAKVGAGILAVAAALGVAAVAIGAFAQESEDAYARLQASTGVVAQDFEDLKDTVDAVYRRGYGESLDEVGRATATVKQHMHDLDGEDLENVTAHAMNLADVFDSDITEVTRGAQGLMNAYGITSEKAFDLFTHGARNGLNMSQDLFDQMGEFSMIGKQAGYTVEELFGLMQRGAENGVYNMDRVNNSILEFGLRTTDGNKDVSDNFKLLSKDTQQLWKDMQAGEATAKDLSNAVVNELKVMDDQQTARNIGVSMFGTLWEDNADSVMYAMFESTEAMKGFEGAADHAAESMENTFSNQFKGIARDFDTFAGDIVESWGALDFAKGLVVQFRAMIPPIVEFAGTVVDYSILIGGYIADYLAPAFNVIADAVMYVINDIIIPLIPLGMDMAMWAIGMLIPVIELLDAAWQLIVVAVQFLVEEVIVPLMPLMVTTIEGAWSIIKPVLNGISFAFTEIVDSVTWALNGIKDFFNYMMNVNAGELLGNIANSASGIIKNILPGLDTGLGRVPYDEMPALLHKDEAVIQADDAQLLRDTGMLIGDGRYPKINLTPNNPQEITGGGGGGSSSGGGGSTTTSNSKQVIIHAPVTIHIDGSKESKKQAQDIANQMDEHYKNLQLAMEV